jgi:hypothetical protein
MKMFKKIFFGCLIAAYTCLTVPLEESQTPVEVANCPPGYFCVPNVLTRSITPQPCSPGTFSGFGASSCTPCDPGYWTTRHGSSYCDVCPIGHMCSNASMAPEPCPLGTANPWIGLANCFLCGLGDYTSNLQSPACTVCPHGHFCANPAEKPKPCPPGII